MTYLLRCPLCGSEGGGADPWSRCTECGSILMYESEDYRYKLTVDHNIHSIWRYSSALPLRYASSIVTLSEGFTPIVKAEHLGRMLKISNLYIKDEGRNPTGSFRDRCASILATDALHSGFKHVAAASNGNMGASLAAYARRADLYAHIVIPRYVDEGKLAQMIAYGADIIEYGTYVDESIDYISSLAYDSGWYQATPELNALSFEALKTIAYEIWEELGVPDNIIVPVGGGSLLVSIWKGFRELEAMGLSSGMPKLICVQTEALHPIVDRFRGESEHPTGVSKALALLVARPVLSDLAVKALKDTDGDALTVSDSEIMKAMILLARCEGVFTEFSSASSIAAARKLIDEGLIDRSDVTVCIATSSGLKTTSLVEVPGRGKRRRAIIPYGGKSMKIRILEILSAKPRYGYDVWKNLGGVVSLQAVYQHLERLEAEGLISSYTSDGRRYYQVSDKGRRLLEALKALER